MSQTDIADILGELSSGKHIGSQHRERMRHILLHFHKAGLPLSVCCDKKHPNRAASTLQEYARELDLIFPDYCPRKLKKKPEAA